MIETDKAATEIVLDEAGFQSWCIELVDRLAPVWERYTLFPRYFEHSAFNFLIMRSLLREYFPLSKPYGTILEIGCGVGMHSLLLSRFAKRFIGADIPGEYANHTPTGYKSSTDIASTLARDILGENHLEFIDTFPHRMKIESGSVDMVFTWTVLEHIPDLQPSYAEMMRVLKPGGVMIHVVPNVMSAIETIARDNIDAAGASRNPIWHPARGRLRALKDTYLEFKQAYMKKVRGYKEIPDRPAMVVPQCHSEFLSNYHDQLNLYISDSYLFPLIRLGMQVERVTMVRDFNHALVLRKPT